MKKNTKSHEETQKKENILIIGTGSLATLFAARLSSIGVDLRMLGSWQDAIVALNKYGAGLVDSEGEEKFYPVNAVTECKNVRYAIILIKSWQTEDVAYQLKQCLAKDGVVLTLQNGLGNGEILAEFLGKDRVAQGVTIVGASLLKPGIAKMSGEARVSVGAHPRLGPIESFLRASKFEVTRVSSQSVQSLIWSKLVINAAINPLTALLDIPNGGLLKNPEAKKMMGNLARETASLAKAQNIPLFFENPVEAAEDVARQTSSNISSMLQDLRRGAPTEIEAICGEVARIGEKFSVPTPTNKFCYQLVKARTNRGKIREI